MDEPYVIQKWIRVPLTADKEYCSEIYQRGMDLLMEWGEKFMDNNLDIDLLDKEMLYKHPLGDVTEPLNSYAQMGIRLHVQMKPLIDMDNP